MIVFDEATSFGQYDGRTSHAGDRLLGKKTIIMIAHRVTTLADCDRIYMVDSGRVIDEVLIPSCWFNKGL